VSAGARRRWALGALVAFLLLTVVGTSVGGGRPAFDQGVAPEVLHGIAAVCALIGGLLLVLPPAPGPDRGTGAVVLVAVVVVVGVALATDPGPNIGAGFVQLVALVAIVVALGRLIAAVTAGRRR
jgi:hypothetical protein